MLLKCFKAPISGCFFINPAANNPRVDLNLGLERERLKARARVRPQPRTVTVKQTTVWRAGLPVEDPLPETVGRFRRGT